MKYRITHPDPYNWCIEEWQEGGELVSRGPYAGQAKQARWMAAALFYPTLRDAALALVDKAAGDALLVGECQTILEAIEAARLSVLATLALHAMGITDQPTPAVESVEQ